MWDEFQSGNFSDQTFKHNFYAKTEMIWRTDTRSGYYRLYAKKWIHEQPCCNPVCDALGQFKEIHANFLIPPPLNTTTQGGGGGGGGVHGKK